MGQLSLFPEETKPKVVIKEVVFDIPKVGQWISCMTISDRVEGGTVYTSCDYAKVIEILSDRVICKLPKTTRYHDVLDIYILFKYLPWTRVLPEGETWMIENLEMGLTYLARHYHVGETDVMNKKEMKKAGW